MNSQPGIRYFASLGLLTLLPLFACSEAPQEPVASLTAVPAQLELPFGYSSPLELRWKMIETLGEGVGEPLVFVHLLDDEGAVRLTLDHPFPGAWQADGEAVGSLRMYHSALASALPPGTYRLTAGLYRGERRFALDAGADIGRLEYELGKVVVPRAKLTGPQYSFSGSWGAAQPGSDQQVRARRWLASDGSLDISKIPGAGSLWLQLRLPRAGDGMQLVLEEGEREPSVRLTGSCGEMEVELRGGSVEEVAIPVPTGTESCQLQFDANFHLVNLENLGTATLILEQMGWEPDS